METRTLASGDKITTLTEEERDAESDLCVLILADEVRSDPSRVRLAQEYKQKLADQRKGSEIVLRQHYHYASYRPKKTTKKCC